MAEIQITDDHEEQCKLIMTDRHREAESLAVNGGERSGEELFDGGYWRLNRDKEGSDSITINSYQFEDEPGFILDGRDHELDIIHRRALAMRYTPFGEMPEAVADLQISIEDLVKRITFKDGRQRIF